MSNYAYADAVARRNEIMKKSTGLDYDVYASSPIAFDYERMMADTGYSIEDVMRIQAETKVGNTPLFELFNLTKAVRKIFRTWQRRKNLFERRSSQRVWQF